MPGLTRRYSEYARSEADSVSTIDVFPNSRISYHSLLGAEGRGKLPVAHGTKRRRTVGLNARFDSMMNKVDLAHPASSSSSGRRRASSGSSSLDGFAKPSTPLDAYSDLGDGRLGRDFSVIKMHGGSGRSPASKTKTLREPPPPWLCDTILTLEPSHPLRIIIPKSSPKKFIGLLNFHNPETETEVETTNPIRPEEPEMKRSNDSISAFLPPDEPQDTEAQSNAYGQINQETEEINDGIFAFQPLDKPQKTQAEVDIYDHDQRPSVDRAERLISEGPAQNMRREFLSVFSGNPLATARPSSDNFPTFSSTNALQLHNMPFSTTHTADEDSLVPLTHISAAPAQTEHTFSTVHELTRMPNHTGQIPFSMPGPLAHQVSPPLPTRPLARRFVLNPDPSVFDAAEIASATHFASRNALETDLGTEMLPDDINTNSYATPGPTYTVTSPAVYFDSPVEDPSASDPIDPSDYRIDVDIDYDKLDFRWEPFFRKGLSDDDDEESFDIETKEDVFLLSDNEPCSNPTPDSSVRYEWQDSGGDFALRPDDDDMDVDSKPGEEGHLFCFSRGAADLHEHQDECEHQNIPWTPEEQKTGFAPAPGIFISPLRGDNHDHSLEEENGLGHNSQRPANEQEKRVALNEVLLPLAPVQQGASHVAFTPTATSTPLRGSMKQPQVNEQKAEEDEADLEDPDFAETDVDLDTADAEENTRLKFSQESNDSIESWTNLDK